VSDKTAISWTDSTWSPWEGCTRVSEAKNGGGGCDNCYAEAMNRWLRKGENWGPGAQRREYSDAHWDKPVKWNAKAAREGRRLRVFPSVCDPFDNEVDNGRRSRFISLMFATPHLDWLLLTKRIGNVRRLMEECTEPGKPWTDFWPPNAWLGATIVNQAEADRDVPKLLALPARVRFLSIEPMLGPVDLRPAFGAREPGGDPMLRWVIAGGESGPHARPAHPDWFRSLRDQCAAAGVPFHFKQWGEWGDEDDLFERADLTTCKLHDWRDKSYSPRVGKAIAGRLLDGTEHNGFPS
jgi:protein gp37